MDHLTLFLRTPQSLSCMGVATPLTAPSRGDRSLSSPTLIRQQKHLKVQEALKRPSGRWQNNRNKSLGCSGIQAWPLTQSPSRVAEASHPRSLVSLLKSAGGTSQSDGPRWDWKDPQCMGRLCIRERLSPEHIVPILLHIGHLVERDVQDLANSVSIFAVLVSCANSMFVQ